MSGLPSIRRRLSRALLGWSIVSTVAVTSAIMLAVPHEVDELLDDTLEASAEVLTVLLSSTQGNLPDVEQSSSDLASPGTSSGRFVWQVVDQDGSLVLRSARAPTQSLQTSATAGFSDTDQWRILGRPLGSSGRMLYVAQTTEERLEAKLEIGLGAAVAAMLVGLVGQLWLRGRVRRELSPLGALSSRLLNHDPVTAGASLGQAEREELQPVHAAIDDLSERLSRRLAKERAFSAHAAHALRTPLAGIDAQLAVALRESPPELQPRIRRAREAAARLQRVVVALLGMFRADSPLNRTRIDLEALLDKLPVDGLEVSAQTGATVSADADILTSALLNLLDNALRYGASHVLVTVPAPGVVRVHDDGPGVTEQRRHALEVSLASDSASDSLGLGLRMADLAARAHGGRLLLPVMDQGFAADLVLETS